MSVESVDRKGLAALPYPVIGSPYPGIAELYSANTLSGPGVQRSDPGFDMDEMRGRRRAWPASSSYEAAYRLIL